eukprot:6237702-Prymnesium_polylepis.1
MAESFEAANEYIDGDLLVTDPFLDVKPDSTFSLGARCICCGQIDGDGVELKKCGKPGCFAFYCSQACQARGWRLGHKQSC